MPTPMDKALNSKNTFFVFTGLITGVALWSIWGSDMFPATSQPTGDPSTWTIEEMRSWLSARNLYPDSNDNRAQLLERINANLRTPRA